MLLSNQKQICMPSMPRMPRMPCIRSMTRIRSIPVNSNITSIMSKAKEAQKIYATFNQEKVDIIFKAVAMAANTARIPLAELAFHETHIGNIEDKYSKEIIYYIIK